MEDVLRPRSLDSWAVIRAWFEQDDTWSVKGKSTSIHTTCIQLTVMYCAALR
jgi:hypothetical protein